MAHMIPRTPKEFQEESKEGFVFRALSKLDDDYYVFHSVSATVVSSDNTIFEREMDFVVAHKEKGLLCLEVKAGSGISYENREWRYTNGTVMKHNGPYNQAATAKRTIINAVETHRNPKVRDVFNRCKFLHGVFFVDFTSSQFKALNGLPEDASEEITLFAEDLLDPTEKIESIFNLSLARDKFTKIKETMNNEDFSLLINSILCPQFKLIPSPAMKDILAADKMNQLLNEQYRILDFLEDQGSAVINGAAGTGKTMLAVEKARRHSMDGEKVLFLCYNALLCDDLIKNHKKNPNKEYSKMFENVDFFTASRLAKEKTGNFKDLNGLINWLYDCLENYEKFGYRHIIVDEGQDFGLVDAETDNDGEKNCSILEYLQMIAEEYNGTFYLFYDKYQMIQGKKDADYKVPDIIDNADCRLTLKRNCRNTAEIAKTSVTPLKDNKNKAIKATTACIWEMPIKPSIHLIENIDDTEERLNKVLDKYEESNIKDIVILTPFRMDYSYISDNLSEGKDGYYKYSYKGKNYNVSTCKKFKGLEADAIVLIDLNKDSFEGKNGMEFYVGSSRAKHRLDIIAGISPDEYGKVLADVAPNAPKTNNKIRLKTLIGSAFGADVVE